MEEPTIANLVCKTQSLLFVPGCGPTINDRIISYLPPLDAPCIDCSESIISSSFGHSGLNTLAIHPLLVCPRFNVQQLIRCTTCGVFICKYHARLQLFTCLRCHFLQQ